MAMNTPYLTADTSAVSNINTPYLLTGATAFNSDLSSTGTLFIGGNIVERGTLQSASAASFGALTATTGTFSGAIAANSGLSIGPGFFLDANSGQTHAAIRSALTTASGSSVLIADGAFMFTNISVTSCTLQFRSGVTTYTLRADAASVL